MNKELTELEKMLMPTSDDLDLLMMEEIESYVEANISRLLRDE